MASDISGLSKEVQSLKIHLISEACSRGDLLLVEAAALAAVVGLPRDIEEERKINISY